MKRILGQLGYRYQPQNGLNEIVEVLEEKLKGSGSLLGYSAIHRTLSSHYIPFTTREVDRNVLILDPEGVKHRS